MKLRLLLLATLLMLPSVALSQTYTTIVTATVTDASTPTAVPYAGGTGSATFVPGAGGQQSIIQATGQTFPTQVAIGKLSSSGSFSVTVTSNDSIFPTGSQWQFNICAADGGSCFSATTTIHNAGGTQSVSSTLNAASPVIIFQLTNTPPGPAGETVVVNSPGFSYGATTGGTGTPCVTTPSSIQYDNSGAFGCEPDLTFNGTHTLTLGASGIFTLTTGATLNGLTAGMMPTAIPIANVGSAGLSGTSPITINSAGAIGCATCAPLASPSFTGTPTGPTAAPATNTTQLATTAFVLANGLTNPMTTLGDLITGGSSGAATRLPGPTTPASVPQTLTSTPSGGVSGAEAWAVPGVTVDAQSSATPAVTATDVVKMVQLTNSTTSTALSVPSGATLSSGFAFAGCNTGTVVATATPTTSTVNGNTTQVMQGKPSGGNPECAFWWLDASNNYWAAEILPTDANGRLQAAGFPNETVVDGSGYVVGGGTAQAQTATLAPALTSLVDGTGVCWKPNAANTAAAPTLAVNGLTATTITKLGATALIANDIVTTAIACAKYNSSGPRFELQNPQTSSGSGVSSFSGDASNTFYSNSSSTGAVVGAVATQTAGSMYVANTSNAYPAPGAAATAPTAQVEPEPTYILDPASWWSFFDDFDTAQSATNVGRMSWQVLGTGATATFITGLGGVTATTSAVGVVQCAVAATASDACYTRLTQAGLGSFMGSLVNYTKGRVKVRIKLTQTTNTNFFVGFVNPNTSHGEGTANYVGIGYNVGKSDTGWMCVVNNGTATRTAISGTLDTNYHDLVIRWTAAKTVACSVDGGTETALATTNFPTDTSETPELSIDNNATSTAISFQVDYWMQALGGLSR